MASAPLALRKRKAHLSMVMGAADRKSHGAAEILDIVLSDAEDLNQLLSAVRLGDSAATQELFERYRHRLRRLVELRLNRRLQGRIDPSDVVQDALLQAAKGLEDYVREPRLPVYLWLRILTQQQLLEVHRHHLRTGKRDAAREVAMDVRDPGASSACLAAEIVSTTPTPSEMAQKTEQQRLLEEAIEAMEPMDREILALRHFEQLSNSEVACLLEIGETAASQRFFRALKRLRQKMKELGIPDPD